MSTELKLEIGEGQIQNAIAVALVDAFSPEKKDALIRDIVRAHLSAKKDSYSRDTLLSAQIGDLIRKVAQEEIVSRVQEMKPEIVKRVRKVLGKQFEESVYLTLEKSLKNIKIVDMSISVTPEFDD